MGYNYHISTHALDIHSRALCKPNEDFVLIDDQNGIFMVLDGITRVHAEYEQNPFQSAACDVNGIFSKLVHNRLIEDSNEKNYEKLLKKAVIEGNEAIKSYRRAKPKAEWGFYPGTLGIVGILREGRFHYVCVGDCLGMLLRGNSKLMFGTQPAVSAVDLHNVTKEERYSVYCNHPENPLSYSVYNGDSAVAWGVEYSFIDIYSGDILFLSTDGMSNCIKLEKADVLRKSTAEELIKLSEKYDILPYSKYADDKAVLKIDFI